MSRDPHSHVDAVKTALNACVEEYERRQSSDKNDRRLRTEILAIGVTVLAALVDELAEMNRRAP